MVASSAQVEEQEFFNPPFFKKLGDLQGYPIKNMELESARNAKAVKVIEYIDRLYLQSSVNATSIFYRGMMHHN